MHDKSLNLLEFRLAVNQRVRERGYVLLAADPREILPELREKGLGSLV